MSDALDDLLGRSRRPDRGRADQAVHVRDVVVAALELGPDTTVTVQELACTEPGCPPVETVIAVLEQGDGRRWTLHSSLSEVDDDHVRTAVLTRPRGDAT